MKTERLIFKTGFLLSCLVIVAQSCQKARLPKEAPLKEPALPETPYAYFEKHSVNSNLATLGRVLFYDKALSVNNAVSCGSCHKQQFAFADNVRFNKGFDGQDLKRNSPSIQGVRGFQSLDTYEFVNGNWVFTPRSGIPNEKNQTEVVLFWDGRQKKVDNMVLNPVLNHKEMNMPDFETLTKKLESISYYTALFKNAYGDEKVSKERIAYALEGFLACLNTSENTFNGNDPNQNLNALNLSPLEEQGRQLFHNKYNCAKCHDPSNTGDYNNSSSTFQMFNIGLDEVYKDQGVGAISGKPGDLGVFKVPTLKNISLTAPYMHDGRFSNLGEVIDHYSHNIKPNQNLSPLFRNFDGTPRKLNIQPAEKQALIAFLNTLKDSDFLNSPMYSDPFNN